MKYTKLAAVALASVMMLSACGQSANSDNQIVMTVEIHRLPSEFNYYMNTYKGKITIWVRRKNHRLNTAKETSLSLKCKGDGYKKLDSDTQSKLKDYQKSR